MRYADALDTLSERAAAHSLESEHVSLSQAVGRRASRDHVSTLTIPPFHNSGVDGYCFASGLVREASSEAPVRFQIAGTLFPGAVPPETTPHGFAWEIMTGAPFPQDCDCAVKVEDTPAERNADGRVASISITAAVPTRENLRAAGDDFAPGQRIVARAEKVRAEHLLGLASNGYSEVEVFKRPRVTVVPTGAELVSVGEQLKPGQIYNSSLPYLVAALSSLGCDVETKPILRDDPQAFEHLLKDLKKSPPSILITTGAVSMGKADFVRAGLEAQGASIDFHRVDIRPGKPILFAHFDQSATKAPSFVAFGLPGNPVSTVVGVRFFIEPYLRALFKLEPEKPLVARVANAYRKPAALRCFLKAKYEVKDLVPMATILSGQPSFMTRPLLDASAWAVVPEGVSETSPSHLIEIFPQTSDF